MSKEIEEAKKEWEKFWWKLQSAIRLVGGVGRDRLKDMSLEEIYKHLYPNGIYLAFRIDRRISDKTYC